MTKYAKLVRPYFDGLVLHPRGAVATFGDKVNPPRGSIKQTRADYEASLIVESTGVDETALRKQITKEVTEALSAENVETKEMLDQVLKELAEFRAAATTPAPLVDPTKAPADPVMPLDKELVKEEASKDAKK